MGEPLAGRTGPRAGRVLVVAGLLLGLASPAAAVPVAPVASGAPGATAVVDGDEVPGVRTELTWDDERIAESSGLAFAGGLLVTTNDSGDGPRLYVVDPATGTTVGTTTYELPGGADPVDVEALAPVPGRRAVWVADVGDNRRVRSTVAVHRVPVRPGDRTVAVRSVELAYPDGAHDAETLLSDPRTGRLHVVTKSLAGGTVYAAPTDLAPYVLDAAGDSAAGRPAPLEAVGRVPGFLTDGLLLADGAGVVLRDYAGATAYTWPGLERITPVALPPMRQGEAVARRGSRLWASTEGAGSTVVSVPLPAVLRAREVGRRPTVAGRTGDPTDVDPADGRESPVAPDPPYATEPTLVVPPWLPRVLPAAALLVVAGVVVVALALRLRRSRRT